MFCFCAKDRIQIKHRRIKKMALKGKWNNGQKVVFPQPKRVVSVKPGATASTPAAGAANESRPWQTAHGHDRVIDHRQVAAVAQQQFNRVTFGLEEAAEQD